MKRTLAIILVAILAAFCVFAATSTKFTKYGNIFKSGEYTLKGTSYMVTESGNKTGTGNPVVVAEHAGDYYLETSDSNETIRILIQKDAYYMISDSDKTIISMTYEEGDDEDLVKFPVTYEVQSSGNAKLDGKSYYYEKTKETDGTISTYWYNGSTLYAIQNAESIIYITSVEQKVDASLFTLPTGYDVMDLTDLFGSLFSMDSSDDYSDWYSSGSGWDNWDSYTGDGWTYDSSSSNWWDDYDWDYDDEPHYYDFGKLMGLNDKQASEFNKAMLAMEEISWGTLNEYYTDNYTYDLKGQKLGDVLYMNDETLALIQKLVNMFKK